MIYRRDKKDNSRFDRIFLPLLILLFLFFFFIFTPKIADKFSGLVSKIFTGISGSDNIVSQNINTYLAMVKNNVSLMEEVESLKDQVITRDIELKEQQLIQIENDKLKEILGRKDKRNLILANVLLWPDKTPYDTLVIDIGENLKVLQNSRVFAHGNILLGTVEKVYENTSLVSLFSTPDRVFDARIGDSNAPIKLVGRGGGAFQAVVPKELNIFKGDAVIVPSLERTIIGYVESVIEDPRDPFAIVLVSSPVPLETLRFVEIEK